MAILWIREKIFSSDKSRSPIFLLWKWSIWLNVVVRRKEKRRPLHIKWKLYRKGCSGRDRKTAGSTEQSVNDRCLFKSTNRCRRGEQKNLIRYFCSCLGRTRFSKGYCYWKGGARLKEIATWAREDIERNAWNEGFMNIQVSVLSKWSDDPRKLKQLGYK